MVSKTEKTLKFQAEVGRLLDIVANSLYSNRDVFLRELISNASDACDKLRYLALTNETLAKDSGDFKIEILPDAAAGALTLRDNGVGMNRDELVENLGTIAHSGTGAFIDSLEKAKDQETKLDLIGQFGVGFYSAFMVADEVTVESRKAGEREGWRWRSDGKGEFTVEGMAPEIAAQGTSITLKLKDDAKEFLNAHRLEQIVRAYSDHIAIPIRLLDGEEEKTLNQASALWTRPKPEITDEQYQEFYHHVAHSADTPWKRLHFRAEGVIEYTGLLFIPSRQPMDLFEPERRGKVKLYVKRVFISDDCEGLVPPYLRFLRGVIDSEDLPLNVSREMLQHNPMVMKIRGAITKRVLSELESTAEKEPESYNQFWSTFGAVLKEGIYEFREQREQLLKLARFRSTTREGWVSLDDYIARMKPGQEQIYFITGESLEALKRSPQLEGFAAKGVEVLLLTDPVDDFWVPAVGKYDGKAFQSVTRGGADLDAIEGGEAASGEEAVAGENQGLLIAFLKQELGERVKDVRASKRLTSSPACLVADEGDLDLNIAKILGQHKQLEQEMPRVLEVNPRHPLSRALTAKLEEGAGQAGASDFAWLLFDQARILQGETPCDPIAFTERLTRALTSAGKQDDEPQAEVAQ